MVKLAALTLSLALCLSFGCGDSDDDLPEVDCESGDIPTYTEIKGTVFGNCTGCHATKLASPRPMDAPEDVNFDTYAQAKDSAEQAAGEVNEGAMPPKGYPTLSGAEKQSLYKWALCGTPE